jgi:glutamine synthetase
MADDRLRELAKTGVTRVRVHYADLIGTTRAKVIPLDVHERD